MSSKSILDSNKNIEILKNSYLIKKMSTTDIAHNSEKLFGKKIGSVSIYNALKRNLIPIRSISESVSIATATLDSNISLLNEELIEWIDGFLLGDGGITFTHDETYRGSRFVFGSSQKEWAEYSRTKLMPYMPSEVKTSGKIREKAPNPIWSYRTLTHSDIINMARRWYPSSNTFVKKIPNDVRITPTSILLWYLGDGSISKIGMSFFVRFATCAFCVDDIKNILIPKLKELGLNAIHDESKNDVRITSDSISKFFDIIGKKSPIGCYNYKFEYGDWMGLHRLADVVKNNQEKWRVQYMFKQGKLDCQKSPGGRLILFNDEQRKKIRDILDNHIPHNEYDDVSKNNEMIKVSSMISNDIERWNARYLITRGIIKAKKSLLLKDQALLLKEKLAMYGETSAIPNHMINKIFLEYRENGFPYYQYSNEELKSKFNQIKKINQLENQAYWDGTGCELANYFHPHMFECSKRGKMSPIEFFNSDIDFKRGIMKLIALYSKITPSRIREICSNEAASSRINNFPPRVMVSILKKYFNNKNITMFDPCSGFSGRLIGACASNIVSKYIGVDLSDATYNGLLKTKKFLSEVKPEFVSELHYGNCIDVMNTYDVENAQADFVFTSPPFLDVEKYKNVDVETDYNIWKKTFIEPFIKGTHRVLKNGGIMAVYIEAIGINDFPKDFEQIALSMGYVKAEDFLISMPCRENLRANKTSRNIKIIAFRKNT